MNPAPKWQPEVGVDCAEFGDCTVHPGDVAGLVSTGNGRGPGARSQRGVSDTVRDADRVFDVIALFGGTVGRPERCLGSDNYLDKDGVIV